MRLVFSGRNKDFLHFRLKMGRKVLELEVINGSISGERKLKFNENLRLKTQIFKQK